MCQSLTVRLTLADVHLFTLKALMSKQCIWALGLLHQGWCFNNSALKQVTQCLNAEHSPHSLTTVCRSANWLRAFQNHLNDLVKFGEITSISQPIFNSFKNLIFGQIFSHCEIHNATKSLDPHNFRLISTWRSFNNSVNSLSEKFAIKVFIEKCFHCKISDVLIREQTLE